MKTKPLKSRTAETVERRDDAELLLTGTIPVKSQRARGTGRVGGISKSRASPPAPCSIFGLYSALPSRGSQLRRHQCRRLAMSKHYETSCSASPPSASQLLHSLRPLVNVSSPPSASLSSAGCFITALRDQLLPVPHLRSSAEQMLHCSSTAARGSEENGQVSLRRAASRWFCLR